MFRNYLTVALRNLVKHRLYSAINVIGLAVGLSAAVLILLLVRNELTYDRFITDKDRIVQTGMIFHIPGRPAQRTGANSFHFGPTYAADHPEQVQDVARLIEGRPMVQVGDSLFYETSAAVDMNFFQMFDYPFLTGDAATALLDPSAVILTEEIAIKLFGTTDVIGRTLALDGNEMHVTAVLKDLPPNTHLRLGIVVPMNSPLTNLPAFEANPNWGNVCCTTYIRYREGVSIKAMVAGMDDWIKRRAPPLDTAEGPLSLSDLVTASVRNLPDIHTDPVQGDMVSGISMAEIWTLVAVAVLLLVIASINFMNLATARATQRAREVSIRKVVGASRAQIVTQFIGESVLITLLGMVLAVALVEMTLPAFSTFIGKQLTLDYADAGLVGLLIGLALLVGVAGGSYPAFFLSAFNPARVLKGSASGVGGGSGRLRATLVVVQFAISITLMVATAVVYGQFLFAQNKNLGFDKENMVVIGYFNTPGVIEHRETFMERLKQHPAVVNVGVGGFVPGDPWENNTLARRPGDTGTQGVVVRNDSVSFDYFQTLGMRIIAGRTFDRARPTDVLTRPQWQLDNQPPPPDFKQTMLPAAVVINQSAVAQFGYASQEAAIGQEVTVLDSPVTSIRATIIGVVEDFHYASIHRPISPSLYMVDPPRQHAMAVRLRGGMIGDGIAAIDGLWAEMVQDRPISRVFLDDSIQALYQREEKTGQAFAAFSGLAILIACLGLFGLASFTVERRTKEIGLRKVLGAGVPDIVRLLVWQFSKPVLVANIIAWPLAWWGMSRWLEGFAYRIDLNPALFVLAGSVALSIAWGTVAVHAVRVAQSNPIKALRYE
ncbi:MAG: hypothetical protein RLY86_2266 [Pseudomonadota bacterium]|jgi:putative ABC transport system permease protein